MESKHLQEVGKMQKSYYIQSLAPVTHGHLGEIAKLINELGPEKAKPVTDLLQQNLGFKIFRAEDGEMLIKAPEVLSTWGVRALSKKLITFQDVLNAIAESGADVELTEEQLDEIVEKIASDPEYPNHVHQSAGVIMRHVYPYIEGCMDGCDDDEEGDEDEDGDDGEKPCRKAERACIIGFGRIL